MAEGWKKALRRFLVAAFTALMVLGGFPWLFLSAGLVAHAEGGGEAVPDLEASIELPWETLFAGDPLRVVVRITSPRYESAFYQHMVKKEQGQASEAMETSFPDVPFEWVERVKFSLFRIEGNKELSLVTDADWSTTAHMLEDTTVWSHILPVRTQEWILPADAANLLPGEYVLKMRIEEDGENDPLADLVAQGEIEKHFSVNEVLSDSDSSVHLGRLAYQFYILKELQEAAHYARLSVAFPFAITNELVESYFILIVSGIALNDLQGAENACRELLARLPVKSGDLVEAVNKWQRIITKLQEETASDR